jgi:hypothetical protein
MGSALDPTPAARVRHGLFRVLTHDNPAYAMTNRMTTLDYYARSERASADDLARKLRGAARQLAAEADRIASGSSPATHVVRHDLRELEIVCLAYDKARAALVAAQAMEAER